MSDTIYVIGSGKTIDYIDPAFFDGKNVIAVNGQPNAWVYTTTGLLS